MARQIRPQASSLLPFPRLYRGSKVQLVASLAGERDSDEVTRETLRDNISVPFGIAILSGYGVATPPALTDLLERGRLDALRLLGTEYALLSSPKAGAAAPDGMELVSASMPGVRLYRAERVLPRVFVTFAAERRPVAEIARRLLDPDVVAGTVALLDERQIWNGEQHPAGSPVPCRIDDFTNVRVRATCDAAVSGLAIFVEQHAAGWSARVDGAPAPLLLANAVMRAVPLPAGKHTVEVAFEPPGLRTGALLSLLGLLVTVLLLLAGAVRGRRQVGTQAGASLPQT
jgi:hypothetical protein